MGVRKVPGSPPISMFAKLEQAKSLLFSNILSPILNDSGKTSHPAQEDALHLIKVRPFQISVNPSSISSIELNSRSIRIPFNNNNPKSQSHTGFFLAVISGETFWTDDAS
jgi:hypothetical protein